MLLSGKLLNPETIDGESLAPMMQKLSEIAQVLHDKIPEFVAIIPFGSRTKGYAKSDSDLDIYLVTTTLKNPCGEMEGYIIDELRKEFPSLNIHIDSVTKETVYELGYMRYFHMGNTTFIQTIGEIVGPHRLGDIEEQVRETYKSSPDKTGIISAILGSLQKSETKGAEKAHLGDVPVTTFVKHRMRLWANRIASVLGIEPTDSSGFGEHGEGKPEQTKGT